jgi:hypothetical protein
LATAEREGTRPRYDVVYYDAVVAEYWAEALAAGLYRKLELDDRQVKNFQTINALREREIVEGYSRGQGWAGSLQSRLQ